MVRTVLRLIFFGFALGVQLPAFAQDDVVASGLNNPRKLTYGDDGTLYIAEAGTGGATEAEGAFGAVTVGLTSQVTAVSPDGDQSVVISDLVSTDQGFGSIYGASMVLVSEDSYWLVLGEGPKEVPFNDAYVNAVVQLDRETLEVLQVIDLLAYETDENPDGDIISSNPIDLAVGDDGTLYIANAGCNCVMKWTEADGIQTFASWMIEDNPVPTSVAIGTEGDIYVGFLTGFPFPAEGSRIEQWSAAGELVHTYPGLTLVTDVLVDDEGVIYAVQMASGFGDSGYIPESGSVVIVSDDGLTPIAEGLNYPFGIAKDADGGMVLSVNAAFSPEDSGQVIRLSL
jgi:hypothetical protein